MAHLLASWESLYANSALLRTLIAFAHIGGLVVGGGAAIVADRSALSLGRTPAARAALLQTLAGTHRVAVGALAFIGVSDILLLAADTETFLHSRVFWLKMALFVLLLVNGLMVMHSERRAAAGIERAWTTLRWSGAASLALWFLLTLAGAALPNL